LKLFQESGEGEVGREVEGGNSSTIYLNLFKCYNVPTPNIKIIFFLMCSYYFACREAILIIETCTCYLGMYFILFLFIVGIHFHCIITMCTSSVYSPSKICNPYGNNYYLILYLYSTEWWMHCLICNAFRTMNNLLSHLIICFPMAHRRPYKSFVCSIVNKDSHYKPRQLKTHYSNCFH
jgi:hypothetical protein